MPDSHVDPTPLVIAAIDAGSNAIRVEIAAVSSAGELSTIESERAPVRLGHRAFTRGELDADTIQRAVAVFARFRKLFDHHGVSRYRAVATSALRAAHNRDLLLHQLWYESGIELEVIDGDEEARLVQKAVAVTFQGRADPRLILDLGGGSLEIMTRPGGDPWEGVSLDVGNVRLLEMFGLSGALSDDEALMVRRYVTTMLRSACPPQTTDDLTPAAACGGNAEALARLFGGVNKHGLPSLTVKNLEQAVARLWTLGTEERMSAHGIRRDRAEVIAVAALVLATACRELGVRRLSVPGVGLREGILRELAETAVGEGLAGSQARDQALIAAARVFARRVGHDLGHGEHVLKLSRSLFQQLEPIHGLSPHTGVLLEVAALLHDIGEVVHRRSHHKHGEYVIRNGYIPGLESPKREMVAALVRAHRKSLPDKSRHPTFGSLPKGKQKQVRKLAAILRIADALDTDHRKRVRGVTCELGKRAVHLTLEVEDSPTGLPITLRKTDLFERELDCEISWETRTAAARERRQAALAGGE